MIGVGDDAAVVNVPSGMQLAVSVDTMVEGVHFFPSVAPADLAYKLLAVNLSDMAAMGAEPKWATLALTLPHEDAAWLAAFSNALDAAAESAGVQLIGGDTTKGPLCLSLTIMGLVPKGKAISRAGAEFGDDVWLSNTVGDAALALKVILGQIELPESALSNIAPALHRPTGQVALGLALRGVASAALDISDGLLADLAHVASLSQVCIEIHQERVPLSDTYRAYLQSGGSYESALAGGDDYQLAFTAPSKQREAILAISDVVSVPLTRIGSVVEKTAIPVRLLANGKPVKLNSDLGFQHFG